MPSLPLKRKQSVTDSEESSITKRPRVNLGNDVGESSFHTKSNDGVRELQAKLEEMTKRCSELEEDARIKSEAIQRANDGLKCGICLGIMRNPYTLECGHSACLKCLRRSFTASRELNGYPPHGDEGYISMDDDSNDEEGDERTGEVQLRESTDTFQPFLITRSHSQSQPRHHPRRHRFRSLVHFKKQCPTCKTDIRRRPVVDYTLRHVIDDLRLPPLSPAALMERDSRWGRRRDVWKGIFPADPYADNHRQGQQRQTRSASRNQTPTQVWSETLPAPTFTTRRNQRRTERRLHPYAAPDADTQPRQQTHESLNRQPFLAVPASHPRPALSLAISSLPSPFLSRATLHRSSGLPEEPEPEPEPEFALGQGSEISVPVPRLPFLDGIDIVSLEVEAQVETEAETLRASPPLPELEHLPSSSSAPSSQPDSPPQPTIQEILQILRPQPRTNSTDTAEAKEAERVHGGVRPERATEDESQNPDDEDEDEHLDLIHAMLHGESANTARASDSAEVERYPVYIEELELPDGGEGAWLGADLED